MATCTKTENWGNLGCEGDATATFTYNTTLSNFSHDNTDANHAEVSITGKTTAVLKNVKWDNTTDNVGLGIYTMTNIEPWKKNLVGTFAKSLSDNCADLTDAPMEVEQGMTVSIDAESASVMYSGRWGVDGEQDNSAHDPATQICPFFFETLPDNFRILPPQNLSASWPTILEAADNEEGVAAPVSIPVSVTSWSKNVNINGTPTNLPNARTWNFALDVIDGATVKWFGRTEINAGEELSATIDADMSQCLANAEYRFRLYASNEYNSTSIITSPVIYVKPPKPTAEVVNWVYNSANATTLQFRWSKPVSGGKYAETVTYDLIDVTEDEPVYIKTNVSLGSTSNGAGLPTPSSSSNFVSIGSIPTGRKLQLVVKNTTPSGSNSITVETRSPVQPATIGNITWNETRREFTISGVASNVRKAALRIGYSPDLFNADDSTNVDIINENIAYNGINPMISGQDLNHGEGQKLYAVVMPLDVDNEPYYYGAAMKNYEIPNPILGVKIPKCGSTDAKEYIVDIIERKADGTVTARWQNGDRLIKIDSCNGPIVPGDLPYDVYIDGTAVEAGYHFKRPVGLDNVALTTTVVKNTDTSGQWQVAQDAVDYPTNYFLKAGNGVLEVNLIRSDTTERVATLSLNSTTGQATFTVPDPAGEKTLADITLPKS